MTMDLFGANAPEPAFAPGALLLPDSVRSAEAPLAAVLCDPGPQAWVREQVRAARASREVGDSRRSGLLAPGQGCLQEAVTQAGATPVPRPAT